MIEIKTRRRIDSSESERPSILLFSATAEAAARCSEEGEEGKEREVSTAVVARSKYQQQIRWDSERQMMISSPARGGGDGKALEEEEQVRGECERRKSIATTETAEEEGEGEGREEQKKRKVKVYNAAALEDGMVWEGEVEEQMLVVEVAAKGAEAMMEPMRSKRVEVAVEGGAWEVVEGATTIGDVAAARGEGCIVERQRAVEMRVVEDEQVIAVLVHRLRKKESGERLDVIGDCEGANQGERATHIHHTLYAIGDQREDCGQCRKLWGMM